MCLVGGGVITKHPASEKPSVTSNVSQGTHAFTLGSHTYTPNSDSTSQHPSHMLYVLATPIPQQGGTLQKALMLGGSGGGAA